MKYKNKERVQEVITACYPHFEIIGCLQEAGIDWSVLEPELFDKIFDAMTQYAQQQTRIAEARYLGRELRRLR